MTAKDLLFYTLKKNDFFGININNVKSMKYQSDNDNHAHLQCKNFTYIYFISSCNVLASKINEL